MTRRMRFPHSTSRCCGGPSPGPSRPGVGAILSLRNARPHTAGLSLSCREVMARAAPVPVVVGPCLEEEGAVPHAGYWVEGAA